MTNSENSFRDILLYLIFQGVINRDWLIIVIRKQVPLLYIFRQPWGM